MIDVVAAVAAVGLVVAGVWMLSLPGGLIAAGVGVAVLVWLSAEVDE